jgi:hypothetical protein
MVSQAVSHQQVPPVPCWPQTPLQVPVADDPQASMPAQPTWS